MHLYRWRRSMSWEWEYGYDSCSRVSLEDYFLLLQQYHAHNVLAFLVSNHSIYPMWIFILVCIVIWGDFHVVHTRLVKILLFSLSQWFKTFLPGNFWFLVRAHGLKVVLFLTNLADLTVRGTFDTFITSACAISALTLWLCTAAFSAALKVLIIFWRLKPWNFSRSCLVSWSLTPVTIWSLIRKSWHLSQKLQIFERIPKLLKKLSKDLPWLCFLCQNAKRS